MTRYTLMEEIKDNLKEKLTAANGYQVEPVSVVIGFPRPDKINQFPTLCVYMVSDAIFEENMDDDRERVATILVVGYTNDTEDIYKFSEDVEKFLYSTDFTYGSQALLDTAGATFSIGGVTGATGINMFDLQFVIHYNQDLT